MRIFIWINCADIDVYRAETIEDLSFLYHKIKIMIDYISDFTKTSEFEMFVSSILMASGIRDEDKFINIIEYGLKLVGYDDRFGVGTKFSYLLT